mmetsp:Transcript_1550/g.2651  ORF Transcript_1550/g.2651 Transcript_1550/m.2651 type:complete len:240 (+) Transcript_1550:94-813(+)
MMCSFSWKRARSTKLLRAKRTATTKTCAIVWMGCAFLSYPSAYIFDPLRKSKSHSHTPSACSLSHSSPSYSSSPTSNIYSFFLFHFPSFSLLVLRRQHELTRRTLLLPPHIKQPRQWHVIPHQTQLHLLPPQLGTLIHQSVLNEHIRLLQYFSVGRVGRFDDAIPEYYLILGIGGRGVGGDYVDEELFDVPVEGGVHVGMQIKRKQRPIHTTVILQTLHIFQCQFVNVRLISRRVSNLR